MIDISKEANFEIREMETDKGHIHFLSKSEPKVSVLSTRKLKPESKNRIRKTQKEYPEKYYGGEKTLRREGYSASALGNFSKEAAEYYIRNQVEVDAYIPELKVRGFYAS